MYREVLVLCYGAELSYQQIADQLGVPLSIVKNRLYRGKRLLKDAYLQQEGGSENVL
jgi:RNA polymerase sigma-70 factor (ECF subfamily)